MAFFHPYTTTEKLDFILGSQSFPSELFAFPSELFFKFLMLSLRNKIPFDLCIEKKKKKK